jgi:hypothetical protein
MNDWNATVSAILETSGENIGCTIICSKSLLTRQYDTYLSDSLSVRCWGFRLPPLPPLPPLPRRVDLPLVDTGDRRAYGKW